VLLPPRGAGLRAGEEENDAAYEMTAEELLRCIASNRREGGGGCVIANFLVTSLVITNLVITNLGITNLVITSLVITNLVITNLGTPHLVAR
jgi:hypothetical protein